MMVGELVGLMIKLVMMVKLMLVMVKLMMVMIKLVMVKLMMIELTTINTVLATVVVVIVMIDLARDEGKEGRVHVETIVDAEVVPATLCVKEGQREADDVVGGDVDVPRALEEVGIRSVGL